VVAGDEEEEEELVWQMNEEEGEVGDEDDEEEAIGTGSASSSSSSVYLRGPTSLPSQRLLPPQRPVIRPKGKKVSNFRCYHYFFI
jgi:hypothetical protein